jgi:hypothetical protein
MSTFSKGAREAANRSGALRLVLIDGDALTSLMVRFNVGVRVARTVDIKRVDLDYFEDAEAELAGWVPSPKAIRGDSRTQHPSQKLGHPPSDREALTYLNRAGSPGVISTRTP